MSEESFSDPEVAKLMNDKFVCIKVDREERPDIDEIYMGALHAMGQQGGWPLSAWLTPDGKPFFGGTYFPPKDSGQRPGFSRVCKSLANAWAKEREQVLAGAGELSAHLEKVLAPALQPKEPSISMLAKVLVQAQERFDADFGGFGYPPHRAPKFPEATELQSLLRLQSAAADAIVIASLQAMQRGGIHDQIGGGFHRYSTDRQWLVPHFEKMLYDNALLASCYLEGYLVTQDASFAATARSTLDYMLRELQAPAGGFWASQDAQSEGVEGKYFVWQLPELQQLLGEHAAWFAKIHGVTKEGNWEHQNVLWLADPAAVGEHVERLNRAKQTLLAARQKRIAPGTDDKVLASWNGLALTALADGYRVLGVPRYLLAAQRCAGFLLEHQVIAGRVMRSFQGGKALHQGCLDDYVALANGLLSLFEVDGDPRWLLGAQQILKQTVSHFRAADGAFWFTADDHEQLVARTKTASEGAIPSGNALAAQAFLRAGLLLGDEGYYEIGASVLRAYHELLSQGPAAAPSLVLALQFYLGTPKEIVVVGEPEDARSQALLHSAWRRFPQAGVVVLLHDGNQAELLKLSSVYRDKQTIEGVPAAYVCERGTCLAPVTEAAKLEQLLRRKP